MHRRSFIIAAPLVLLPAALRAGTLSPQSFGNDDALDWADECVRGSGAGSVELALNDALSFWSSVYLQAPTGARAIAAAEVVAAVNTGTSALLPQELRVWVEKRPKQPFLTLRALAGRAVVRVAKEPRSELRSLWSEGGPKFFAQWEREVDDLLRRLGE